MSVEKIKYADCDVYTIDNPTFKEPSDICVTSYYGQRDSGFHYGIDTVRWQFGSDGWYGTFGTVQAFANGKVTYIWDEDPDNVTFQQKSGNSVVIDHGNGYVTKCFHLALGVSDYVKVGQIVKTGDSIGYMGNTGASRGGHLHFEILHNGVNVDPLPYLLGEKMFDEVKTVKTYEVVTTINGYNNAGNAANQLSPTTKVQPGTYYVYNKYPDGVNGMFNITNDKTGNAPWCWINPTENVKVVDPNYDKYKDTPVYDLPYENKVLIIDKSVKRTEKDCVKAIKNILAVNPAFDVEIAKSFFKIAPQYGIDPMMAISQSILETGWFKFNSPGEIVTPDQHNYGAMGVTDTGVKGDIYDTIDDGVTAQMQHLWAYATRDARPNDEVILDKRFGLVSRGCAPYWQQLAGRWAYPGYEKAKYATAYEAMLGNNTYGQLILIRFGKIVLGEVSEEEIEKYFPKEKEPVVETPVQEPKEEPKEEVQENTNSVEPSNPIEVEEPKDSEIDVNKIVALVKKLIEFIIRIFKK